MIAGGSVATHGRSSAKKIAGVALSPRDQAAVSSAAPAIAPSSQRGAAFVDQSHFIHEFRGMTGEPPARFFRAHGHSCG